MGIIPTETIHGDDCALCFAAGHTPSKLKLFVSGIRRSEWYNPSWGVAPNGYFDLYQDEHSPCGWTSEVGIFPRATFHTYADDSIIQVWSNTDKAAFVSHAGVPCAFGGSSEFDGEYPLGFQGGYARLMTPAEMAEIIEGLTPMIDPNPRMECFPMKDGLICIRYAGKRDGTHIYFEIDTTI